MGGGSNHITLEKLTRLWCVCVCVWSNHITLEKLTRLWCVCVCVVQPHHARESGLTYARRCLALAPRSHFRERKISPSAPSLSNLMVHQASSGQGGEKRQRTTLAFCWISPDP